MSCTDVREIQSSDWACVGAQIGKHCAAGIDVSMRKQLIIMGRKVLPEPAHHLLLAATPGLHHVCWLPWDRDQSAA